MSNAVIEQNDEYNNDGKISMEIKKLSKVMYTRITILLKKYDGKDSYDKYSKD